MKVYLIKNIEEYGKLIAYCIEKDISVFRSYWDDREKGDRCYHISFKDKRLYYSSKKYYENEGAEIIIPEFYCTNFGEYKIIEHKENKKELSNEIKEYNNVVEFLNNFISGAKMSDDFENEFRASRALKAFEANPEINIFSEEFITNETKKIFGTNEGE